jgi:hypothetical protein
MWALSPPSSRLEDDGEQSGAGNTMRNNPAGSTPLPALRATSPRRPHGSASPRVRQLLVQRRAPPATEYFQANGEAVGANAEEFSLKDMPSIKTMSDDCQVAFTHQPCKLATSHRICGRNVQMSVAHLRRQLIANAAIAASRVGS